MWFIRLLLESEPRDSLYNSWGILKVFTREQEREVK